MSVNKLSITFHHDAVELLECSLVAIVMDYIQLSATPPHEWLVVRQEVTLALNQSGRGSTCPELESRTEIRTGP